MDDLRRQIRIIMEEELSDLIDGRIQELFSEDRINDLVEQSLDNSSQLLNDRDVEKIIEGYKFLTKDSLSDLEDSTKEPFDNLQEDFGRLQSQYDDKVAELEDKISELETSLKDKTDELERLIQRVEESIRDI
jgi:hypothetical protein